MTSWNSSDDGSSAEPAVEPAVEAELAGRRRRSRVSRERRVELLAEFDRSGSSAPRFAERAGVSYSTFAGWLHRWRQEERAQGGSAKRPARRTPGPIAWLEAVAERPEAEGGPLWVRLPGGAWMEPGTAKQLRLAAVLLRELENAGGWAGMLSYSGCLRVLVALEPYDMRAGFNRLQGFVAERGMSRASLKSGGAAWRYS